MQEELEVKNVSQDINEIFTITGFSDMFTVKKKMREFSVDGCTLIGKGGIGPCHLGQYAGWP